MGGTERKLVVLCGLDRAKFPASFPEPLAERIRAGITDATVSRMYEIFVHSVAHEIANVLQRFDRLTREDEGTELIGLFHSYAKLSKTRTAGLKEETAEPTLEWARRFGTLLDELTPTLTRYSIEVCSDPEEREYTLLRLRQATDYGMALANRIEGLLTGNLDYEPRLVEQRVNDEVARGSVMIVANLMGKDAGFMGNVSKSNVDVVNDPTLTALIFSNIYYNARKSAEMKGVEPEVTVSAHENCGYMAFEFADNGMGMDAEKLGKLERDEIGFGFASCKRIAELIGGRLYVESSTVGTGTTIVLELKLAA